MVGYMLDWITRKFRGHDKMGYMIILPLLIG